MAEKWIVSSTGTRINPQSELVRVDSIEYQNFASKEEAWDFCFTREKKPDGLDHIVIHELSVYDDDHMHFLAGGGINPTTVEMSHRLGALLRYALINQVENKCQTNVGELMVCELIGYPMPKYITLMHPKNDWFVRFFFMNNRKNGSGLVLDMRLHGATDILEKDLLLLRIAIGLES